MQVRSLRKILYRIGILAVPIFVVSWILSTWLLANKVPRRPKGVGQTAVFLWAPAVGFPGGLPREGMVASLLGSGRARSL